MTDYWYWIIGTLQIDDNAVKLCRSLFEWYPIECLQQLLPVVLVRRMKAGLARRVPTRSATKMIYCQTGVVGYSGQAGRAGGVTRFE